MTFKERMEAVDVLAEEVKKFTEHIDSLKKKVDGIFKKLEEREKR